jgi:hypothetical protein
VCGLRHRTLAGRRGRRRPGPALKLVCAWRGKVRMACEEVGADERLQSQRMWRSGGVFVFHCNVQKDKHTKPRL